MKRTNLKFPSRPISYLPKITATQLIKVTATMMMMATMSALSS
jgi:hypothetical protein